MKLKPPRPVSANDYPRIVALWQAAGLPIKFAGRDSPEAFQRQMAAGVQTVIGVETETGDLVGVVVTTHDSRKGWINRLAVHPDWRRQGVAKSLVAAGEEVLREQGIDVIAALIEIENDASLTLFHGEGYKDHDLHYVSKRSSEDS